MSTIPSVPAPWQGVALVCGKCSRKLKGGFGKKGKHDLRSTLRDALKDAGRRRELRVVEVDCLGLCPKRAVSVIGPFQPGQVLAVPAGTDPAVILEAIRTGSAG
ncbi:MAG: hypothetical protein NVSMB18_00120 [Acetobacteraceae bacterium]